MSYRSSYTPYQDRSFQVASTSFPKQRITGPLPFLKGELKGGLKGLRIEGGAIKGGLKGG